MDSLVLLCAHRVVGQCPFPTVPTHLYPILFQAAFLDGRPLVLQDLVATWPFPVLNYLQLVGDLELHRDHPSIECDQAIIQAVVAQLQWKLEEPCSDSSEFQLRVLDMTGLSDSVSSHTPAGFTFWSRTKGLAEVCLEVSKHQQEFQRHRTTRHTGFFGAMTDVASPQFLGVDIHTDLVVDETSYQILHDALQTGAASPLRLKCRAFRAQGLSGSQIETLLESLDPSCLRRVDLGYNCLAPTGLSVIMRHLLRFPELRSLKLSYITMDELHPTSESATGIHDVARQLGMLPGLQELSLRCTELPGYLPQILCDLQAPLESLALGSCSLVPADLTFLSQSFHAPALKMLDLGGVNISQGLLEPVQLLLEKASASLLYLDLSYCHIADSHLAVLLPTLLRCSRLRVLRLDDNLLSKAMIKDLLQKTLELPDLHEVVYPYPLDCYTGDPSEFDYDFFYESVDQQLLSAAEAEISQLLENSGRTDLIWTDNPDSLEDLDYFSL